MHSLKECTYTQEELHSILNNLHLKIATQRRIFIFMKGLGIQLSQYGVTLDCTSRQVKGNFSFNSKQSHTLAWDLLLHVTPDY